MTLSIKSSSTQLRTWMLALCLSCALPACSVYKPDVKQGNIVSAEQVALLKVGMSRQQVQQVLGSPLLQDVFNTSRWDYLHRILTGKGVLEQRVLTVFFDANNRLSHWSGQTAPSKNPEVASVNQAAVSSNPVTSNAQNVSLNVSPIASSSIAPNTATQTTVAPSASTNTAAVTTLNQIVPAQAQIASQPVTQVASTIATTSAAGIAPKVPTVQTAPITQATQTTQATQVNQASHAVSSASAKPAVQNARADEAVQKEIALQVEQWRNAWAARDLERYVAQYAANFQADLPSRAIWLAQRKRALQNAGKINLVVSNLTVIQTSGTQTRARFTQQYQAARYKDVGEKDLFFQLEAGQWKIVAERFEK